jgi:hypothetical protein
MQIVLFFIVIVGCSDVENYSKDSNRPSASVPAHSLQIKKVTQITYSSSVSTDIDVTDFLYNDNKLIGTHSVSDMNHIYDTEIIYDGIKIIQINVEEDGIPSDSTYINYTNNFITSVSSGVNQRYTTNYLYNNGYLNLVKTYDVSSQMPELVNTVNYIYQSGNVVKQIRTNTFFGSIPSHVIYSYDNKNNPLRGMNKYFRILYANEGFDGLSLNNPITRAYYEQGNEENITTQYYQMEYNSNNYPTNIKRFSENDVLISDTTIEYR